MYVHIVTKMQVYTYVDVWIYRYSEIQTINVHICIHGNVDILIKIQISI